MSKPTMFVIERRNNRAPWTLSAGPILLAEALKLAAERRDIGLHAFCVADRDLDSYKLNPDGSSL